MGLAPHLNFCQPHQLAPSAKPVYYIYLTSTTRLLLRRSMNIKLSNYLIIKLFDYQKSIIHVDIALGPAGFAMACPGGVYWRVQDWQDYFNC